MKVLCFAWFALGFVLGSFYATFVAPAIAAWLNSGKKEGKR